MRLAKGRSNLKPASRKLRAKAYISISAILGSTFLLVATSLTNTINVATAAGDAQNSENHQNSSGASPLLRAILGADALKSPNSGAESTAGGASSSPAVPSNTAAVDSQNSGNNNQYPGESRLLRAILSTPDNSTTTQSNPQTAQAVTFPDIQGHWAQRFIEALAARNIILGFPDGTFRPNAPVRRVEFAALIRKAFAQDPIRPGMDFVDVPPSYWGNAAIQEAYRMGFLEGYPNRVFQPEQNIPRVQALVSLASGLDLVAQGQTNSILNSYFRDANSIPGYARNSVAAATEEGIVVNYPTVALLNPNQVATRADVAAFIYQALVEQGKLPPLEPGNIATRYIVNYQPPVAEKPKPNVETLRRQFRLPMPPVAEKIQRVVGGGSSIATPTAFGADQNTLFAGFSFQERTRNTDDSDGAIALGFGVGDARRTVGLETTVSIYDLLGDTFEDGGISFKLHRLIDDQLAVAIGVENLVTWGNPDPTYSSVYGVVSKVFPLRTNSATFTPSITTSVGVGGGRFRSEDDIEDGDDDNVNVFGSVGVRVAQPLSLKAEWTGQDLNLGASIYPIPNVPLVITPAVADVTGNAGDDPRFILGIGYGVQF